jgi:hypothetical protein
MLWDIVDDGTRAMYIGNQKGTPGLIRPIFPVAPNRASRISSHPLLTLLEPVTLGGEEGAVKRHVYVYASGSPIGSFEQFRARCAADPAWDVHDLATGHMVWDDDLPGVTKILLAEA